MQLGPKRSSNSSSIHAFRLGKLIHFPWLLTPIYWGIQIYFQRHFWALAQWLLTWWVNVYYFTDISHLAWLKLRLSFHSPTQVKTYPSSNVSTSEMATSEMLILMPEIWESYLIPLSSHISNPSLSRSVLILKYLLNLSTFLHLLCLQPNPNHCHLLPGPL